MEEVLQFGGEESRRSLGDKVLGGGDERSVTGEPNGIERPQTLLIKVGKFSKSVKTAAVRVTGAVGKLLQLAQDGDIGWGTQDLFQLRQSGDTVVAEKAPERVWREDRRSHNAIVPPLNEL